MSAFKKRIGISGVIAFVFFSFSCKQTPVRNNAAYCERVFAVELPKDSAKLQEYLGYHRSVWPEVEASFRKAGYREIELYRLGNLAVMRIVVPKNADLDSMGRIAEGYDPKCAEWNRRMGSYQHALPGIDSTKKWIEMSPFYLFEQAH